MTKIVTNLAGRPLSQEQWARVVRQQGAMTLRRLERPFTPTGHGLNPAPDAQLPHEAAPS